MHIVDGALSAEVIGIGTALAVAGTAIGLRKMPIEKIPVAGVLSAAFFVASLIHVPVGPSSVHLILNGLAGIVLGWAAFPALFVGLLLQAVFFGFGGVTVLGVNTLIVAGPAVAVHYLCRGGIAEGAAKLSPAWGAVGGATAIAGTTLLVGVALAATGQEFVPAAKLVFVTHVPIMIIEAALTGAAVLLARRVKPELLDVLTPDPVEA
jgi:cobalt/nickel transport system permease protein